MPRRGSAPNNHMDFDAWDRQRDVIQQIRAADGPLTIAACHSKPVRSAPPLRRACDGCGLSKSAFHSTDEFNTHRAICEPG